MMTPIPVMIRGNDNMGVKIPNLNRAVVIGDESEQARASGGPAYRPDPACIRRLVGCDLLSVVGVLSGLKPYLGTEVTLLVCCSHHSY